MKAVPVKALTISLMSFVALALISIPVEVSADEPAATASRVVPFHGYSQAIELTRGNARAVLCPQVGGRVLEFSVAGKDAMWLDDEDKNWKPGKSAPSSAGRFDYGPELTVIPHQTLWAGEWTGRITSPYSASLTSPKDLKAGI